MPRRRDDDYSSEEEDIEILRRHRSGSNRLNVSYGGRPRAHSRGHEESPPNINIYNNADAYQGGPRQTANVPRERDRMNFPAMQGYPYPFVQPQIIQQAAPAPPPAPVASPQPQIMIMPGAYPPKDPHRRRRRSSSSRSSRSHSQSHSRSHSPKPNPYEQQEYRNRIIAEAKMKEEKEKAERKESIERYKIEQARKDREEKEEREKAIEKYRLEQERKRLEEEEHEKEVLRKHEAKLKEEEDEKKKVWEEYELKRKEAEAKKKEAEKAKDEEYKERMRKHMAKLGYAPNQIETMIQMETLKITEESSSTLVVAPKSPANGHVIPGVRRPVLPKLRRKDIALETLKFYGIEWEYDAEDSNYIIILQEMTEYQTDVLFAHTKKLREKGGGTKILPIEEKKERGREELLIVRKKEKNERSKSRHRDKSQVRGARFAAGVLGL